MMGFQSYLKQYNLVAELFSKTASFRAKRFALVQEIQDRSLYSEMRDFDDNENLQRQIVAEGCTCLLLKFLEFIVIDLAAEKSK